jgi:hypothetical protein
MVKGLSCFVGFLLFLLTAGPAWAQYPVPLINQPLVPDTAKPGGAAFTLTVNGTGFVSGSVVYWDGSAKATTFVSRSQVEAAILSSDIAHPHTASVKVVNPTPGGTSNVVFFEVTIATSAVALSPSAYGAGSVPWGPNSVAVGDFNGDGKLDLAVADSAENGGESGVSVLLGNGDGTFQSPAIYHAGGVPYGVAVGDFNGDGKLDLVVADSAGSVIVLLGNGDGTFQSPVIYAAGCSPYSVAVGDFNGDGKLDLAVADSDFSYPCGHPGAAVLLGNGDGTFQPAVNYGAGSWPFSLVVGDFNGDGKLDLVVANNGSNNVSVLLGNGNGTFQAAMNYAAGQGPFGLATADLNGDGKLDLAVADSAAGVSVLLGNGDGTFRSPVDYPAGAQPVSVAVADFNGDGKPDLVVANGFGGDNVSVLLANGNGTFQAAVDWPAGSAPRSVAVGDFNRDGRLDAVASDASNSVSVLLQAPAVSLSNTSLEFANQVVGTTSLSENVTLTNTGFLALTIGTISVTGTNATDFGQINTCDSGLPPGAKCTITLTFTPTQSGPQTAVVTITDNAAGSPQGIALTGTGVASGPNATLSPASATFSTQLVGTTSPAQPITLTNYGTATLSISSITIKGADPGDFAQTSTCGSSVAPGASCTISVTFTPTGINSRNASLSIADNALGSPQKVGLTGTGTVVKLVPTSLVFCNLFCGPYTKSVTLANVGKTTLNITNITIAGTDADFSQTNTCGSSLAGGASCTITVTPRADGLRDPGAVQISDNGGASPQYVYLAWYYHPL